MNLFLILPIVMIIPLGVYFYFFFKRILQFYICQLSLWMKIVLIFGTILFVIPVKYIFGLWAALVLHFFAFAVITDIIMWFLRNKDISKKYLYKIYQLGLIPLLCVMITVGYGYWNMKTIHPVEYTVKTQKNISQNYRIVFISDLHFKNTMTQKELQKYCLDISALKPDIVLLGGDIVDEKTSFTDMKDAFSTLGQISNQFGIYYVYGNHDQAQYSNHPHFTNEDLIQTMQSHNIHILTDTSVRIQDEITIVGRNDRHFSQRDTSQQLIQKVNLDDYLIMLDHQPVDLNQNDQLKYDLQLSGHTHGGQMFPVGIMSHILGFGEMNYGYRQMEHMQVIVSSGIAGWGYPLRTGSQSEYVVVNLVKQ